jgi:hypothetical protein
MPNDYAERIAKLLDRRSKLNVRLNVLDQKSKLENRKLDTRCKIIVGGSVIAHMQKNPDFAKLIRVFLETSVGRPNDRAAIRHLLTG